MQTSIKIFKDLRKFIRATAGNPELYRQNPQDFTRKRKLHFFKLSLMMLSLLKSRYKVS